MWIIVAEVIFFLLKLIWQFTDKQEEIMYY